jgi:hypothetical protein
MQQNWDSVAWKGLPNPADLESRLLLRAIPLFAIVNGVEFIEADFAEEDRSGKRTTNLRLTAAL